MTMEKIALAAVVLMTAGAAGCALSSKTDTGTPEQTQTSVAAAPTPAEGDRTPAERVIHFAFDSSAIDAENRRIVDAYGHYLRTHPTVRIRLEGHADERGTREYNLALGERRARSIAQALRAMGVSESRITIASHGEDRPAAPGHDEAAWAQNRRGVIVH